MSDPRLYVALDLPSIELARDMVRRLGDAVISYKIGLQLLPLGGAEFGRELAAMGKNVFLDFKLHDIDATVEKATRSISEIGADLLTVHARPDVMRAAAKGRSGNLKVLGVTVLTSLDEQALIDIGFHHTAEELVLHRVRQAFEAGIDGVVSSPLEAVKIRAMVPRNFLVVTPGVRMAQDDRGDQKRIATPSSALKSGASHIVVGRPITQANSPRDAALRILEDMAK
ncbi:MAG: orotidine-5'-phosphate decarboxylase [Hellea sp.]|nr:orotidine-5'-phosphate decarboxylase [Hellea sp.]